MSEAQALNDEIEIEVEQEEVIQEPEEGKKDEPEGIEIEIEAGKPPARRLSGFEKRLRKKDTQVEEARAEAEALREENKLLRLAQEQTSLTEPDPDKFDSDEEYRAAVRAYDRQELERIATEKAQTLFDQSQQNITQADQASRADKVINDHYDRVDQSNIKNYDELEGNATDILGEDFVKTIIASTDDAHLILASMGAAPGKTAQIAKLVQSNPTRAFANALGFEIHPSLKPASLKPTPDPEETVDPGQGVVSTIPGLEGVKFE